MHFLTFFLLTISFILVKCSECSDIKKVNIDKADKKFYTSEEALKEIYLKKPVTKLDQISKVRVDDLFISLQVFIDYYKGDNGLGLSYANELESIQQDLLKEFPLYFNSKGLPIDTDTKMKLVKSHDDFANFYRPFTKLSNRYLHFLQKSENDLILKKSHITKLDSDLLDFHFAKFISLLPSDELNFSQNQLLNNYNTIEKPYSIADMNGQLTDIYHGILLTSQGQPREDMNMARKYFVKNFEGWYDPNDIRPSAADASIESADKEMVDIFNEVKHGEGSLPSAFNIPFIEYQGKTDADLDERVPNGDITNEKLSNVSSTCSVEDDLSLDTNPSLKAKSKKANTEAIFWYENGWVIASLSGGSVFLIFIVVILIKRRNTQIKKHVIMKSQHIPSPNAFYYRV